MKITTRMWILIIAVLLSCMSIFVSFDPFGLTPLQQGVVVSSVNVNSTIYEQGLRGDMVVQSVNGKEIRTIEDYQLAIDEYSRLPENITSKLEIRTNSIEIIGLFGSEITEDIQVKKLPKTKLETGLDLQGGARAFVRVDADINSAETEDLISVLENRLNTYGLSDIEMYVTEQTDGEELIVVEIAGSNPEELERLIGSQGNFVAKIGNETVFVGGNEDITHVGRSGQEALIESCQSNGVDHNGASVAEFCTFRFVISLSAEAAQRHADITDKLSTEGGCIPRYDPNCYLEEQIDFYVDDILSSSLNIGADLKGHVATSIQISGTGSGPTRDEAVDATRQEMKTLQTILITGSLPYDLEIVKIDRISPNLGEQFVRQILLAGLFAIIAVTIFTFIRYRKIKISLAIVLVSLSEVFMILGIAALIRWNLDLLSIAGIIAAIGTGIDSQIIILDESRNTNDSLKDRIRKALFIITTAFATTFFALLPLTGLVSFLGISAASAGVLQGFALTTLVGILVGVLISRPAFADIARQLEE